MLQVFLNVSVFGMDVQAAIEAPRFATYSFPASFAPHDYFPGRLNLESRFSEATADALNSLGHRVEWWPDLVWRAGGVCAILVEPETNVRHAGADPRRPSYALAW
jgi:gamma-glutamyltranspeptidase/glutathione hydrolase